MKPRALVVLGAGESQLPLISQAKRLGLAVIGVDRNTNAPGLSLCSEVINVSTHDPQPTINRLAAFSDRYQLVGVVTRSNGPPTIARAVIAKHFGLPGPSIEASRIAISKRETIQLARKVGIPAPLQYNLTTLNSGTLDYPVVVKPDVTITGKSGIYFVGSQAEAQYAMPISAGFSQTGDVEIEQYIEGSDVLAISLVQGEELVPWCVLDEHVGLNKDNQFTGLGFSLSCRPGNSQSIWQCVEKLRLGLDLKDGILISAFRVADDGKAYLVELHLDLGGDFIMDTLIPHMITPNPLAEATKPFIGLEPLPLPKCRDGIATIYYIYDFDRITKKSLCKIRGIDSVISIDLDDRRTGRTGCLLIYSLKPASHRSSIERINEILGRSGGLQLIFSVEERI